MASTLVAMASPEFCTTASNQSQAAGSPRNRLAGLAVGEPTGSVSTCPRNNALRVEGVHWEHRRDSEGTSPPFQDPFPRHDPSGTAIGLPTCRVADHPTHSTIHVNVLPTENPLDTCFERKEDPLWSGW